MLYPMSNIPRARTLDEVSIRLERLEGTVREAIHSLHEQLGSLVTELSLLRVGASSVRGSRESWHDVDVELQEFRRTLQGRVEDPNDQRFNSDRARAMVHKAIEGAKRDDQASKWNGLIREVSKGAVQIAVGVGVGYLLAHIR
jgi:hypothetical protein